MLRIVYISMEIYLKYYTFLSSNLHQKLQFKNRKILEQKKQTQFTLKSIALMESIDHFFIYSRLDMYNLFL